MKISRLILATTLIGASASGQQLGQLHFPEPSDEFGLHDVTADLTKLVEDETSPAETPDPQTTADAPLEADKDQAGDAVHVTPGQAPAAKPAPPHDPGRGVDVQVSRVKGDLDSLDPEQVSVKAPFPAKPLTPAPAGWKFIRNDDPESGFDREVELTPGTALKLTIRPHILVPDTDGAGTFGVVEPGFEHTLQYRQTETVGSLLGESIRRLREDDARMGDAILRLEQLLVSLPTDPEP